MARPSPEKIADIILGRRQVYGLDVDSHIRPNDALRQTGHRGCTRRASWLSSLSLGHSLAGRCWLYGITARMRRNQRFPVAGASMGSVRRNLTVSVPSPLVVMPA